MGKNGTLLLIVVIILRVCEEYRFDLLYPICAEPKYCESDSYFTGYF